VTSLATDRIDGKSLVSESLFERFVSRIMTDHAFDHDRASKIMSNALAFLATCGTNRSAQLSPSETVDIGWHTAILYTREYAAICDMLAGGFIHHVPDDGGTTGDGTRFDNISYTVACIREAGYHVDDELWFTGAKCTQCHNGCHDDPPPGLR
jgi:hypothetical protein